MTDFAKKVFISYRRTNNYHALAVYQALTAHGYDVFMDYQSIDSGSFERIIMGQVRARAHFVLIATPSALQRCTDPGDWVRREIEAAIDSRRNIVPLMFEGFEWRDMHTYLVSDRLKLLPQFNSLRIPADFFEEAMARLMQRFLVRTGDEIEYPALPQDASAVQRVQQAAQAQPQVQEAALSASEYFERAMKLNDNSDQQIAYYTEAIRLQPDYAHAYYNRGLARQAQGDLSSAIDDYNKALRIQPYFADAYVNRGVARKAQGDLSGALDDYNKALRIQPDDADAYVNRGNARQAQGDLRGAIDDYNKALRIQPYFADAYNNRGYVYYLQKDYAAAIRDYEAALRIQPDFATARKNLANARKAQG